MFSPSTLDPTDLVRCTYCGHLTNACDAGELMKSLSDFCDQGIYPVGSCPNCGGVVFPARGVYHVTQEVGHLEGHYFTDAVVLAPTDEHAKQMILQALKDGGYEQQGVWHDLTNEDGVTATCDARRLRAAQLGIVPCGPFQPRFVAIRFGTDHEV